VGQVFTGTQTVTASGSAGSGMGLSVGKNCDEWRVNVEIQGTDLSRGTICGSMEALDVPRADSPVLTFWRGQIIDNINYFFRAQFSNDMEHWEEFKAFNSTLRAAVRSDHGDDIDLSNRRYVFMRWKEIFFVSPENECNLTIAGFYYCCMDRLTGSIAGYYFDPSTPAINPGKNYSSRRGPALKVSPLPTTNFVSPFYIYTPFINPSHFVQRSPLAEDFYTRLLFISFLRDNL